MSEKDPRAPKPHYTEESSEKYLQWLQEQGLAQQGKLEKIAGGCVVRRVLH